MKETNMSKNLFRKGLVAAAITGLVTTAFAAPAHAAGEIVIAPAKGTAYSTFVDQTFSLATSFAPGVVVPNVAQLKYKLTRESGKAVYAYAGGTAAGVPIIRSFTNDAVVLNAAASLTAVNYLNLNINGALATDATTSVGVTAWVDSNNNDTVDAGEWQSAQTVTFKKYSEVTATTSITAPIQGDQKVTASVSYDGINNEELDPSLSGATFTKADGTALASDTASVTAYSLATNVVTATAANDYAVGDSVTISGVTAINGTYTLTGATATTFTFAKTASDSTGSSLTGTATRTSVTTAASNVAWNAVATGDNFKYSVTKLGSLATGTGVKVQPVFNTVNVGTAATALVTDRTVGGFTAGGVQSSTETSAGATNVNNAFSVYAKTVDTTTAAAALAGKTVSYSVTVTAGHGSPASVFPATAAGVTSSTATVTINGVTYTNAAALPGATGVAKATGVTGTDGKLVVSGTSTGLKANDTIVFAFSVENYTASATVTETAPVASNAYINYQGDATNVVAGTTVNVTVSVVDQFGAPVADNAWTAFATLSQSTGAAGSGTRTTAATNANAIVANVVSGKATLSLPDNGAGIGQNRWTLNLRARDLAAGTYTGNAVAAEGTDFTTAANTTFNVNLVAAADLVAGKIALSDNQPLALVAATGTTNYTYTAGQTGASGTEQTLSTTGFGNYDARGVVGTAPTPDGGAVVVNGVVSSASTATYAGVAVSNASVTVSGAGLQFKVQQGGANVWGKDTLTFNANNSGAFALSVYSLKAGAQTVTITSGAATSTVKLYFQAAAVGAGTSVVITPATGSILPGTSFSVSAAVTDASGNPVAAIGTSSSNAVAYFSLKVTDLQGNSTTVYAGSADAGVLTKVLTFGANDSGTVTVVATYDADGSTATKSAVVATSSFKVGSAAVASLSSVAAVAQAQTSSAVSISATAKDAAGAALKGAVITFSSTGAGYLSAATATTDANGVATVKLIGNVAGANSVVASANGTSAGAVTVTFGNSDASLSVAGHRVTAAWSYAAGKKVVITRDGVRIKSVVASDDAADSFSFNVSKKGTHKVTVSVAGVVTDVITVK